MQMRYQLRHSPKVLPEGGSPADNSRNLSQPGSPELNRAAQAGGVSEEAGTVRL
jgi:hypothetical protein